MESVTTKPAQMSTMVGVRQLGAVEKVAKFTWAVLGSNAHYPRKMVDRLAAVEREAYAIPTQTPGQLAHEQLFHLDRRHERDARLRSGWPGSSVLCTA